MHKCFPFYMKISSIRHPLSALASLHLHLGDQSCWCTSHCHAIPPNPARALITSRRGGESPLATVRVVWEEKPLVLGDADLYQWGCAWDALFCVRPQDEHQYICLSVCIIISNCNTNLYVYTI